MNITWEEEYRPKTIGEMILPNRIKAVLLDFISKGEFPSLLFHGIQGSGKTTAAIALCNELGFPLLKINASEDNGIDVIRGKVRQFASTRSLTGKPKVILLDEADGTTKEFQQAFRGITNEFTNVRFILTANYPQQLKEAISSRTTSIEFTPNKDERTEVIRQLAIRLDQILNEKGIKFNKADLAGVIKKFYPDNRKIFNQLQGNVVNGELVPNRIYVSDTLIGQYFTLIKDKDFVNARKFFIDNPDLKYNDLIALLFKNMDDYVVPESTPKLVNILANYDYKIYFVSDPIISMLAMTIEIMQGVKIK